jgi:two-component sensor histidine kinase
MIPGIHSADGRPALAVARPFASATVTPMAVEQSAADKAKIRGDMTHGWSIRRRLMLVAIGVVLPFLILSAGIGWKLTSYERETRRDAIMLSVRALMKAVDAFLIKQIAIAETLAKSPALLADDMVAFRQDAERARPGMSGGWVVLSTAEGQQILNMVRPTGEKLPTRNPAMMEVHRNALQSGQPQVSNIIAGRYVKRPIVTIEIPVVREGKPSLVLSVLMDPKMFLQLFEQQQFAAGWLAGLIDRDGNFIARSRDHDNNVGKPASEGFRAAARGSLEGWNEVRSVEGTPVANGHVTSPLSGWVMGLAADKETFEAPIRNTIWLVGLAGGVAMVLSMFLALWAARRIIEPIKRIEDGAHALLDRKPLTFSKTGMLEIDRALDAFTQTASALEQHEKDRDEREAHVHLLMRELSHRSKNLLAIVLAIARQTARQTTTFPDFETRFNARIQALADAHDLLVEQQWVGATLDDLVKAQLAAFGMERVVTSGEPMMLKAEAVQNIGLALHELATNASKHGALSVPAGRVHIGWQPIEGGERPGGLRVTWRESGGPPVVEPERQGFGRFVLERVTLNALGRGSLEFPASGLIWTCEIDPEHIVGPATRASAPQRRATDTISRKAS